MALAIRLLGVAGLGVFFYFAFRRLWKGIYKLPPTRRGGVFCALGAAALSLLVAFCGNMLRFGLVLLLVLSGVCSYFYLYLRRFLRLHTHVSVTRRVKALCWLGAAALVLPALHVTGVYPIVLLHFFLFCLLLDLIYRLSRRNPVVGRICTTGALAAVLTAGCLGWGAYNMAHVVRTDYTLRSGKTEGFTIVQLSDIHTTDLSTPEHVAEYCDKISALNPDFVLLTGDIFEERTTLSDLRQVAALLGGIRCKRGVYYCYGNHDTSPYTDSPNYSPQDLADALAESGVTILQDEALTVGDVTLVGRNDISLSANRVSTEELLRDVDPSTYIVVMDHQPLGLEENAAAGADLQLSGHTHAGQIFPLGLLMELFSDRLNYGSRTIGDFTAITSSGFAGWGYPIRTEARSEYVYIQVLPEQ